MYKNKLLLLVTIRQERELSYLSFSRQRLCRRDKTSDELQMDPVPRLPLETACRVWDNVIFL